MANRSRQTFLKRRKEKERVARARMKELRRRQRALQKAKQMARRSSSVDPDLEGIVPGPQQPVWKMADVLTDYEEDLIEAEEEEKRKRAGT